MAIQNAAQALNLSDSLKKIETLVPICGASDLSAVKCHLCYSTEVVAVCKQCKKFVCRLCQHIEYEGNLNIHLFPYLTSWFSKEWQHTVYCRVCFPDELAFILVFRGASLLLGILALVSMLLHKGWLLGGTLALSAIVIELVWVIVRYLGLVPSADRQNFNVFCKIIVDIEETINANFMMTGGDYLIFPSFHGAFKVILHLKPSDLEKCKNRRFTTCASPERQIKLQAGFVVVENTQKINQVDDRSVGENASWLAKNLICLDMEMTLQELEQLKKASKLHERVHQKYNINIHRALQLDPPHNKNFPIQIIPYLFKSGRKLEIKVELVSELQLNYLKRSEDGKQQNVVGKPMLEKLRLKIPTTWIVEGTDGYYDLNIGEVSWQNKKFARNTPLSLFVEFREPERYVRDTRESLKGEYKIVVDDWTASQLHVARNDDKNQFMVYAPNGLILNTEVEELKWIAPLVKHRTIIEGGITWDLQYISAQKVQSVPNVLIKDTLDYQTEVSNQEKLFVAPSYHVINEVIETLTASKIFIKQITESPGYLTESDLGGKQMLYWEIKGRYYRRDSLQPIVLHLVISGEEPRNNKPNCQGTLIFEVSLRSHVPLSKSDDDTNVDLKEDYKNYKKLIRMAAYRGRQIDYKGRRITAWQKEEQFEQKIKESLSVKDMAVILPSGNTGKLGHLFLQSGECSHESIQPLEENWETHYVDHLPKVVTPFVTWIDKWELLEKVDDQENEHTE